VKTSTANSWPSFSAERWPTPSMRMRLGVPGWNPTLTSTGAPCTVACTSTRVTASPSRTMRASSLVRGDQARRPKWTASIRLVLPAPFGPTIAVSPGASRVSTRS
jgi:hypothetical protein